MQNKTVLMHQQYKMENNEFKKVSIKNRTYCYFNDIIKLEEFDIDNILTDEKTHENILIYLAKIKIDSYDSLPIEKILTLQMI